MCGDASDDEENDVGVEDDDISSRRVGGCGDVHCRLLRLGFACGSADGGEEKDVGVYVDDDESNLVFSQSLPGWNDSGERNDFL